MKNAVLSVLFVGAVLGHADSSTPFPIVNLGDSIQGLGLSGLNPPPSEVHPLKIAVLDNSFDGYQAAIGTSLPPNTQYHPGPVAEPDDGGAKDNHGLSMAQILYGVLTNEGTAPALTPEEFHLYNAYGYTNFKSAVEDAIQRKVDLILYSQVWEYGGNWDGQGFINAIVNEATSAGILWVNAAGDFGQTTFNLTIDTGDDDWVRLPDPNSSVQLRCAPDTGNCPLRLVLSWNSFNNDVNVGTNKDLDLILTDDTLNIVASSELIQTVGQSAGQGQSLYPREIIETSLPPGLYDIRVKDRSHNFSASSDRLRITASGTGVTLSHFDTQESLLNPADNATVITTGASDSSLSSVSAALHKPEISFPSFVKLSSGDTYQGSSNSAAMAAGWIAATKSLHPELTREQLITAFPSAIPQGSPPLTILALGFTFTGDAGCFVRADFPGPIPEYILQAIYLGGTPVQSTAGLKIFFPFDPIRLIPGRRRVQPDDILVIGPPSNAAPNGVTGIFPRTMENELPLGLVEILEIPLGMSICSN